MPFLLYKYFSCCIWQSQSAANCCTIALIYNWNWKAIAIKWNGSKAVVRGVRRCVAIKGACAETELSASANQVGEVYSDMKMQQALLVGKKM